MDDTLGRLASAEIQWGNPNEMAGRALDQQKLAQQQSQFQQQKQMQMMQMAMSAKQQQFQQAQWQAQQQQVQYENREKATKLMLSAETPEGVDAVAATLGPTLDPNSVMAMRRAAMGFQAKQQQEQQDKAMEGQGFFPTQLGAAGASSTDGSPEMGQTVFNDRPYQRLPMQPQYKPIVSGPQAGGYFSETPGQPPKFNAPPGGGFAPGALGELQRAQSDLNSPDPVKQAAAKEFVAKNSGGEFGVLQSAVDQFKTPEERKAYLEKNDPGSLDYLNGIISGRVPVTGFGEKANSIRKLALSIDPKADLSKMYLRQSFQSNVGNPSSDFNKNLTALNTLSVHLGELDRGIDNAAIGNQPIPNFFTLAARAITGDPSVTALNADELAVKLETFRALSGVGVTDQEMNALNSVLPKKAVGKEQAKQFVKSFAQLARQRLNIQDENTKRIMGNDTDIQVVDPSAKESLDRILGGNESGVPKTGDVMQGYRFKGGDPGDKSNWEQVQ